MSLILTESYQKGLLKRNYLFGMEFQGGWIFGRVLTHDDIEYLYDRWIVSSTASEQLAARSALSVPLELYDDQNRELLRVTERDHVYQVFMGIANPRLRVYRQYPESFPNGSLDKIPTNQVPTAYTPGYVNGTQTPFAEPTMIGETMIPTELRVYWQMFNPENFAVTPLVKFCIRLLKVQYFNPDDAGDKQIINNIMSGKYAAHLWTPGAYLPPWDPMRNVGIAPTQWVFGSGTISSDYVPRAVQNVVDSQVARPAPVGNLNVPVGSQPRVLTRPALFQR